MAPLTARKDLIAFSLRHPGAWLDHPWGEDAAKVGHKVFVFFGLDGPELFVGVKLPRSLLFARAQPFVRKFGYGLDKTGWVAARFAKDDRAPVELLRGWIDESYEAVAQTALRKPSAAVRSRTPAARKPRRRAASR